MTIREQIIQAAITRLLGQTSAADRVFRSYAQALDRDQLPAMVVKPGQHDTKRLGVGMDRHDLEIKISFYGRGEPADALLDPVMASAHAVLMKDGTLGGLANQLYLDGTAEPDFDDNDDTTVCIVMTYRVTFATPQHDLTRLAG